MPPGGRLHHHHREHVRVRDDEHGYHGKHDVEQDGGDNVQQVKWQITKKE